MESEQYGFDTGIVAAEANSLLEDLLSDGAVATGVGGLGAAEVHLGNEAGGSAAREVGREFGSGGEMREGRSGGGGGGGGGGKRRGGRGRGRREMGGVVQGDGLMGRPAVGMGTGRMGMAGGAELVVVLVGFRGGQGAVGRGSGGGHLGLGMTRMRMKMRMEEERRKTKNKGVLGSHIGMGWFKWVIEIYEN